MNIYGIELLPLPRNVPNPGMDEDPKPFDSHHFDSLLFPTQEDGRGIKSIMPFDVFSVSTGDPFTLIWVSDVYVSQEVEKIKTEEKLNTCEEVRRPVTITSIGCIQGQHNNQPKM